jgi:hypothetical protein
MTEQQPQLTATPIRECAGQTIAGVGHYGDVLVLRFTDGSACALIAEYEDDDAPYLSDALRPVWTSRKWRVAAFRAGVLSAAEYEKAIQAEAAESQRRKRAEYERLKAEFGEGSA